MNKEQEELNKIIELADWFERNRSYESFVDALMKMSINSGLMAMQISGKKQYKWKGDFDNCKVLLTIKKLYN